MESNYLLWLCLLLPLLLPAQQSPYATNPANARYTDFCYEDPEGFLWISSLHGWQRTDGQQSTTYLLEGEHLKDGDQNIQSYMFPDAGGRLWYTGYRDLCAIDPADYSVKRYRTKFESDTTTLKGYSLFHYAPRQDQLWLVAGKNFVKEGDKQDRLGRVGFYQPALDTFSFLPDTIRSIRFAVDTFATGELKTIIGCLYFRGSGLEYYHRPGRQKQWDFRKIAFQPPYDQVRVTSGLVLNEDEILLTSTQKGLFVYSLVNKRLRPLAADLPMATLPKGRTVTLINDTTNRRILLSEKGVGVWSLAYKELSAGAKKLHPSLLYEAPVDYLHLSGAGNLWGVLADKGGVLSLPMNEKLLETGPKQEGWAGMAKAVNGEIFALTKSGQIFKKYPAFSSWDPVKTITDKGQFLGLKTSSKELLVLTDSKILRYRLPLLQALTPIEVPEMSQLRLAAHDNGDLLLSGTEGIFHCRPRLGDTIFSLAEAYENRHQPGVHLMKYQRYIGDDRLVTSLTFYALQQALWRDGEIIETAIDTLPEIIQTVVPGATADSSWIGTTGGLYLLEAGTVRKIDLNLPHLATHSVQAISPYGNRQLLLGLTEGMVLLDPKTGESFHFTDIDGLPDNRFVADQSEEDSSGTCWLLTEHGPVGLEAGKKPADLARRTPEPYLRQVWANEAPLFSGTGKARLENMRLRHFQNDLRFGMANIGYDHPKATYISIRLMGADSIWNRVPNGESVAYYNLPAGKYTAEYYAIDKNGRPGTVQRTSFSIAPIFYKQGWFLPAMLALSLLTGFLISRYLNKKKLAQAQKALLEQQLVNQQNQAELEKQQLEIDKLNAVERVRRKFMMGLHNSVSGALGAIVSMTSAGLYILKKDKDHQINVAEIQHLAQGAMVKTNEMIDIYNPDETFDKTPIPPLVDLVRSRGKAYGFAQQVDLADNIPELGYSAYEVSEISSIFQEGLQNIHKHARTATTVLLMIRPDYRDDPQLVIELIDDGVGIELSKSTRTYRSRGHGTKNMEITAKELGGAIRLIQLTPKGTKLQLTIPLKEPKIVTT